MPRLSRKVKFSRSRSKIFQADSGDIHKQAIVKTFAGFFHRNSKHLLRITRFRGARSWRPKR